jgi:hypothetical protein
LPRAVVAAPKSHPSPIPANPLASEISWYIPGGVVVLNTTTATIAKSATTISRVAATRTLSSGSASAAGWTVPSSESTVIGFPSRNFSLASASRSCSIHSCAVRCRMGILKTVCFHPEILFRISCLFFRSAAGNSLAGASSAGVSAAVVSAAGGSSAGVSAAVVSAAVGSLAGGSSAGVSADGGSFGGDTYPPSVLYHVTSSADSTRSPF